MKYRLGAVLTHRLPLLFCGSALLAGGASQFHLTRQLDASQAELAVLQQQTARTKQRLDALRQAASTLDGLVLTDPAADAMLAGIAATHGLSLETGQAQEVASGRWRAHGFRLQGKLLHEEILLDILDRWRQQSAFQHQLSHCKLQRQAAELLVDCQLALLLPAHPGP